MLKLQSLVSNMQNVSVEGLIEKARPYFPDVNISEESFESVCWEKMAGKWFEVARTCNDQQNPCGGSMLKLGLKSHCYLGCDRPNLCFKRIYYTDCKVTQIVEGDGIPSATVPFAISMRCPNLNANFTSIPNYFVIWTDYNLSIWVTPLGNAWIFARCPDVSDEELRRATSHIPGNFLRCRLQRVNAKLPPKPPCEDRPRNRV